jgi:hypothetical protein
VYVMSHVKHPLVDANMLVRHQYMAQWEMSKSLGQVVYLIGLEFNSNPPKPIQ